MKPLSEKQVCMPDKDEDYHGYNALMTKDVAEAVEKLKEEIKETWFPTRKLQIERIDKIFGKFK